VSTKAKRRRQQRAQSLLALARHKQLERARRQAAAAQRAERQWQKTLRQLAAVGATLQLQGDATTPSGDHQQGYVVSFQGKVSPCRSRRQVQRWLKRIQLRLAEENMSWAERHVQWMIEKNCDDHGHPWPE